MTYSIWVTSRCNMKCLYCYEGQEKSCLNIDIKMAKQILKFIKNHFFTLEDDEIDIDFHGGEPFLNFPVIKYLVEQIKEEYQKKGIKVNFFTTTNATIMDEEIEDFIIQEITDITLSIDGRPETQNYMRPLKNGTNSYDIVIKNSLRLLKRLTNIRVRMTFDTRSVKNLYADVDHLVELGFKTIVPVANLFDERWDEKYIEILGEQIRKIQSNYLSREDIAISLIDRVLMKPRNKGWCSGGKKNINIYADGELYPCMMVGGVKEFSIGNIWNGIDINKRDKILEDSRKISPYCEGCDAYLDCDGARCKIINKLITGDYYKPPAIQCAIENLNFKLFH